MHKSNRSNDLGCNILNSKNINQSINEFNTLSVVVVEEGYLSIPRAEAAVPVGADTTAIV